MTTLPEIIDKNKRILRAEYQRGFIAGSEKTRKEDIEEFLDDITPEKLHQFYLEAIKLLNSNSYNPNANVPYGQLSEEQKQIDKYIADKLKEKWEKK